MALAWWAPVAAPWWALRKPSSEESCASTVPAGRRLGVPGTASAPTREAPGVPAAAEESLSTTSSTASCTVDEEMKPWGA
ncbi:hypothetical protein MYXA107069_37230 [Myxococcus xanthus]